jgi:hypothetical protein
MSIKHLSYRLAIEHSRDKYNEITYYSINKRRDTYFNTPVDSA